MAEIEVKVFGLQRSGTNYLSWLLDRNFVGVVERKTGWKHGMPHERFSDSPRTRLDGDVTIGESMQGRGTIPLVIRKDYRHWSESIERAKHNFYIARPGAHRGYLYDEFHAAWARFGAYFIRYESLLSNFVATLDYLGTLIGCDPASYEQPGDGEVKDSPQWRAVDRGRYV